MTGVFLSLLNKSITASIVVLVVMLLRFLFKKSPRWISCSLWGLVGLRLVCPFFLESEFSILWGLSKISENTVQIAENRTYQAENVAANILPASSSIRYNDVQNVDILLVLTIVWIAGVVAMFGYGIISYICLRRSLRESVPYKANIRQCHSVQSPFVLGIFKPNIYIPFSLKKRTEKYVVAHENAHIKRKDHIVKIVAFILLCFNWFNPFIWIGYILLCRDIEVACDEKVIKCFGIKEKKKYAKALLDCHVNYHRLAACPVSFGEIGVGTRIKKTLKYKRPDKLIIAASVVCCLAVSGCLLTNPKTIQNAVVKESTENVNITEKSKGTVPVSSPVHYIEETLIDFGTIEQETEIPTEPEVYATDAPEAVDYEEDYYEEYDEVEVVCIETLVPVDHMNIYKDTRSRNNWSDTSIAGVSPTRNDTYYNISNTPPVIRLYPEIVDGILVW